MNRGGSITILVLYIVIIIFISATSLLQTSSLQLPLVKYTYDGIQAKYISEDVFNNIIYNKEIFYDLFEEEILKDCRNSFLNNDSGKFRLNNYEDLNKYFREGIYNFHDVAGKRTLEISMQINYEGNKHRITSHISVLNPLLEMKAGLVTPELLDDNHKDNFYRAIDDLHNKSFDYNSDTTNSIYVHNLENDARISSSGKSGSMDLYKVKNKGSEWLRSFKREALVLNMINSEEENLDLIIGEMGDDRLIDANGSIYIEGNLIINQKFNFNGIIVVNGGSILVNSPEPATFNGLVLYNSQEELEVDKLIFNYNKQNIGRYGSYIPIFIDPEITMFKLRLD